MLSARSTGRLLRAGAARGVIHDLGRYVQAVFGPDLLVQLPPWLADGQRGRGVPEQMRWRPLITFIQTAMDAANAMVSVPGKFGSFGHDYRADPRVPGAGTCRTDQGPRPGGGSAPTRAP